MIKIALKIFATIIIFILWSNVAIGVPLNKQGEAMNHLLSAILTAIVWWL